MLQGSRTVVREIQGEEKVEITAALVGITGQADEDAEYTGQADSGRRLRLESSPQLAARGRVPEVASERFAVQRVLRKSIDAGPSVANSLMTANQA